MNGYTFEKESSGLMKDGDYEVILERIERKTLTSGKEKLSLMFRVRGDVEQPYQNKCIFEDIWQEKENPQFFNRKRINQLLGTQDVKEGTTFATINKIIEAITGSCLIVHVGTVFDDYRGEDVNTVSYYKTSKHKPQKLGGVQPVKKPEYAGLVIDDDDLPF